MSPKNISYKNPISHGGAKGKGSYDSKWGSKKNQHTKKGGYKSWLRTRHRVRKALVK